MPKLLIFAPCEKVIIDQNNNPSLISVIQELVSPLPPDTQIPPNAMGLMRWDIFTLWQQETGDDQKEFVQDCALVGPTESSGIQGSMAFRFTGLAHRNIMSIYGFPLANVGRYELKLWLREAGSDERDRTEIASFPLLITRPAK